MGKCKDCNWWTKDPEPSIRGECALAEDKTTFDSGCIGFVSRKSEI